MESSPDLDLARALRSPLNTVVGFTELLHGTTLTPEQREMLDAVGSAAAQMVRLVDERERGMAAVRPPSPAAGDTGRRRPLDVLIVEDEPDHQNLLVRILDWADHRPIVATSSAEALEMLQHQDVDVVLMDVNLPDLDGVSTTHRIRALERGTGRHVPIIGVTASAADRVRCLEGGMDGFLAKPMQGRVLLDELDRVARLPQYPVSLHGPALRLVDIHAIMDNTGGDRALIAKLALILLERIPAALGDMRDALAREDAPTLRKAAHGLLGSAAIFAVQPVNDAIEALEQMGRAGRLDVAPAVLSVLQSELEQLVPELRILTET